MATARETGWIFGRGASIDCGFDWVVPPEWVRVRRDDQIRRIKSALPEACRSGSVTIEPYLRLLMILEKHSAVGVRHRLLTTNWDTLAEAGLRKAVPGDDLPPWLACSFVYHLNGSVTDPESSDHFSDFLLETDPRGTRVPRRLSDMAFAQLSVADAVVCVGLSFECQTDSSLLMTLGRSLMPVEIADWFLMNPDPSALRDSSQAVGRALPRAHVHRVPMTLSGWLDEGLLALRDARLLE